MRHYPFDDQNCQIVVELKDEEENQVILSLRTHNYTGSEDMMQYVLENIVATQSVSFSHFIHIKDQTIQLSGRI